MLMKMPITMDDCSCYCYQHRIYWRHTSALRERFQEQQKHVHEPHSVAHTYMCGPHGDNFTNKALDHGAANIRGARGVIAHDNYIHYPTMDGLSVNASLKISIVLFMCTCTFSNGTLN